MRVVASLTVMPYKYDKIVKTLESLHAQSYKLNEIYLGVPYTSHRLKIDYPEIPTEIREKCTIVRCEDSGPITKLIGALLQENDPETAIITFDDDMVYHPDTVRQLVNHCIKNPNCAIGSSGMLLKYLCPGCAIRPNEDYLLYRIPKFYVPETGRKVDSIYGYPGALYLRKFFPNPEDIGKLTQYSFMSDELFLNDDIVISGYLSMYNIDRLIFPHMPCVDFVKNSKGTRERDKHEISYRIDKFIAKMNKSISQAKKIGMYAKTEYMSTDETIGAAAFYIIFPIILIILILIYVIWTKNYTITDYFSQI